MESTPPPSQSTAEARISKGKCIQLIDRERSKASSSLGVSFESDCELNELINRDPSKARSSIGVPLVSDCELNELIDSEPSEVISLFSVIKPGDQVDEVLKSTVSVIKDSGQIDNEIRMFKCFQRRFPAESQESLDNALVDLYKDISNSTDSVFMKANYADETEKDLDKSRLLYYRVLKDSEDPSFDRAVKNLAMVLKRQGKIDEAITMLKENRNYCSPQSQNSIDNTLITLYKSVPNRKAEHIEFLEKKLESVENGTLFEGKETKVVKAGKKDIVISLDQERARLLGNIAWLYMQQGNYPTAEERFSKSLSLEPDKSNQCNLAICLMNSGRISKARSLLQAVTPSSKERGILPKNKKERGIAVSYIKYYDRALEMLTKLESQSVLNSATEQNQELKMEKQRSFTSPQD